tara:strand:+ start:2621 stop:2911 length:291 start_codon:yes stop_codon:yes gene_type:complete
MSVWEWDMDTDSLEVEYQFTRGSEGVQYYADGSGEPPSSSEISLLKFFYNGQDVTELVLELANPNVIDDLEREIIEWEESSMGRGDWEDYWEKGWD